MAGNYHVSKKSERNRLAAVRRTHRAPNAKRALAGEVRAGLDIAKAVGVDRIGNESDGTVKHTAVNAAAMEARRRQEHNLPLFPVVLIAGRGVRRHNRREGAVAGEAVKPVPHARMLNKRRAVLIGVRIIGVAHIHAEARFRNPASRVKTGVVNLRSANIGVIIFAGDDFRTNNRIARTVGHERHIFVVIPEEERTVGAVACSARVGNTFTTVSVSLSFIRGVVYVIETRDAVRHGCVCRQDERVRPPEDRKGKGACQFSLYEFPTLLDRQKQ